MMTLLTSILATALLAQPADSIFISGVVVDAAEKPLSNIDVVLWARILADGTAPTLARATTDAQGGFRLEYARQPLPGMAPRRFIFAYQPGRSVTVQLVNLTDDEAPAPVRLTLAEPLRRTLTILGPDDRPLAGVRLAPVLCEFDQAQMFQTPDDRLERLTISSGGDGVATVPYFPSGIDPITVRVTAPGIARHDLPLLDRPAHDQITLKLGRPARLAGSVFNDSGQPVRDVPIEVWVENTYRTPGQLDVQWKVSPSLIRFDSGPVRTQADGSFLTPAQLLTGSSYRITIRPEGGAQVTSDWLKATGERTTFPPFRLKQQRKLQGLVHDRQGKPVAGARVFLPSGEPSTTTNAQGGYVLQGLLPDKTYLLVKADGFRFQGWPAIPAREPRENKLILVRTTEPPERMMAAPAAPDLAGRVASSCAPPARAFLASRADQRRRPRHMGFPPHREQDGPRPCARTGREASFPECRQGIEHPENGRDRTPCHRSRGSQIDHQCDPKTGVPRMGLLRAGRGPAGRRASSNAANYWTSPRSTPRIPRLARAMRIPAAFDWDKSPEHG